MWQMVKYEMEKLLRRKVAWACLAGMVLMECVMIANWVYPGVESVQYFEDDGLRALEGMAAIRETRAIAEEYGGTLSDERVRRILSDFEMSEEDMRAWGLDPAMEKYYTHNALYASLQGFQKMDGSWNGVSVRSVYGELTDGMTLGYSSGWVHAIFGMMYTMLSLYSVLTILLGPLFAEEYTRGMDALILTGVYGKTKCAWAKVIAGFAVSLSLIAILILTFLAVYLGSHGLSGWDASIQMNSMNIFSDVPYPMNCGQGMLYAILAWFTGGIVLTSVSVAVSADARSPFSGLVLSFALFAIPMFIDWSKLGFLNLPAQFFPILQAQLSNMFGYPVLQAGPWRTNLMWLSVPVALAMAAACGVYAKRTFAGHQVME